MIVNRGDIVRERASGRIGRAEEIGFADAIGVSFGSYPLRWFKVADLEVARTAWFEITEVQER